MLSGRQAWFLVRTLEVHQQHVRRISLHAAGLSGLLELGRNIRTICATDVSAYDIAAMLSISDQRKLILRRLSEI
jgi:hypothetical protein